METMLIGYAIVAVFCAGRFTGKHYEEYYLVVRFVGGWLWPVLLLCYAFLFFGEWIPLVWKGNFANSIRVLVFGRNLWRNHSIWKVEDMLRYSPKFKKNKAMGWLYRRAYARLVAMNKDRVNFAKVNNHADRLQGVPAKLEN